MSITDETQVRDALHRATDELPAPVERLTQQARTRGRRLRGRRRVAMAAASLCAVAAIAAPVVATLGPDTARDVEFTSATGTSMQVPVPTGPESGSWEMPQSEMLTALQARLPDGLQITDPLGEPTPAEASPPIGGHRAWLTKALTENGQIVGGVGMSLVSPGTVVEGDPLMSCSRQDTDCQVLDELGNRIGTVVSQTHGAFEVHWVTVIKPDGSAVLITSSNTADWVSRPEATTYGDAPPLTRDELVSIATDPVWTSYVPG